MFAARPVQIFQTRLLSKTLIPYIFQAIGAAVHVALTTLPGGPPVSSAVNNVPTAWTGFVTGVTRITSHVELTAMDVRLLNTRVSLNIVLVLLNGDSTR